MRITFLLIIFFLVCQTGFAKTTENYRETTVEIVQSADDTETSVADQELIGRLKIYTVAALIAAAILLIIISIIIQANRMLKNQNIKITEQQNELEIQNKNLKELNNEKNSVISYVSHDLITPLVNIEGLVQLIKLEEDKLTPEQQHYLDKIYEVTTNGKYMIQSMLNINKIEQEIHGMDLETHNVIELIEEVILGHKILCEEKNIKVNLHSDEDEVQALTDRQYMKQIIANLISNAIKFSDKGSTIDLHISQTPETVVIQVKDEGPGISDRDKERLFLKYEQLSSRPTGEEKSAGLGLAIVKELVNKLNGKITVESQIGEGSTFNLEFLKK